MPKPNPALKDEKLEEIYKKLLEVRDDVLKALEEARKQDIIRHPYEAKVVLKLPEEYSSLIKEREDWIKFFFTVSQVELVDDENIDADVVIEGEKVQGAKVGVKRAEGEKCPRCWIYDTSVGKNGQPVCDRCKEQLEVMGVDYASITE